MPFKVLDNPFVIAALDVQPVAAAPLVHFIVDAVEEDKVFARRTGDDCGLHSSHEIERRTCECERRRA